jgi:hypothetical protein
VAARRLLALALVALVGAMLVPSASADGDPASDTLLINSLYTPVAQRITPPVLKRLETTITTANNAGFKIRVALILDRTDLGAVPQLFGHPEQYVHLLSGELAFAWTGAIIAVQPSGIGVRNLKPLAPAQTLVDTVTVAKPATADTLAEAAATAVRKLAGAHGVTIEANGSLPTSSGLFTQRHVLGALLALVLIGLLVGQRVARRRA